MNMAQAASSIRIVYWILISIVMWIYGIIAFIVRFIQWFHIFILGCRNETLSNITKDYPEYMVQVRLCTHFMTDKRPDIFKVCVKTPEET